MYVAANVNPISSPIEHLTRLRNSPCYGKTDPFRAIREAFGLTQAEASERVGVSRSLWLAWERKERPITALQLGQVAACFSLGKEDVHWILVWWGDARVAALTVAQLNALADRVEDLDPVEILFKLWEEG